MVGRVALCEGRKKQRSEKRVSEGDRVVQRDQVRVELEERDPGAEKPGRGQLEFVLLI